MFAFGLGAPLALTHAAGARLNASTTSAPAATRRPTPRAVAEAAPGARTASAAAAFDAVVMRTYGRYPLAMARGSGCVLTDVEGRSYLDFVAGIATCTLGHAHAGLQRAVSDQLGTLAHVSNLYYIPEQGALASWLTDNSPADKAFFCNSGGEANEAAIKLVRRNWHNRHPGRESDVPVVICAEKAFHGRTLATITATGQKKYQRGFWPLVDGFEHVEYNDPKSLKEAVDRVGDRLAAVMLEPLQGEGGVNPGKPEFFAEARNVCDATGALLVIDEVQTGVGRTGKLWGFEHVGVEPDVFTVAKGLAGGIPIGAMLCKDACDVLGPGDHASTFGGNLIASAAGRVVANELDSGLLDNVRERGKQLGESLEKIVGRYPGKLTEVRGWGLIRGVEIADLAGFDAAALVGECCERGLLLVPAGVSVVRFVPPLVVTGGEVEKAVAIFEEAVAAIAK